MCAPPVMHAGWDGQGEAEQQIPHVASQPNRKRKVPGTHVQGIQVPGIQVPGAGGRWDGQQVRGAPRRRFSYQVQLWEDEVLCLRSLAQVRMWSPGCSVPAIVSCSGTAWTRAGGMCRRHRRRSLSAQHRRSHTCMHTCKHAYVIHTYRHHADVFHEGHEQVCLSMGDHGKERRRQAATGFTESTSALRLPRDSSQHVPVVCCGWHAAPVVLFQLDPVQPVGASAWRA